jgi:uncharacterized protein (DUF2267 family)
MSATGLDVFDKTLQTTNIWLDEISATLGPDRQLAWKVLSVVLHKLRDRMPMELSAHLSAELPLLVRGIYYDQFGPTKQPTEWDLEEFIHQVSKWLSDIRPSIREMRFGRYSRSSHAMFRAVRSQRCRAPYPATCAPSGSRQRNVSWHPLTPTKPAGTPASF